MASLLLLPLLMMRKARPRWVGASILAGCHCLHFEKISTVALPSSFGLVGHVFTASSVDTRSAHVVGHSDASDVVVLVSGSVSVLHAPTLRLRGLILQTLVLLTLGARGEKQKLFLHELLRSSRGRRPRGLQLGAQFRIIDAAP